MRASRSVEEQFFRMFNRLVEPHLRAGWGSPRMVPGGVIVLETRGRRTGRRSRVPLVATRLHDHILVSTFRGGRSQWVKNLSANPDVRYWIGGRVRRATALVIAPGHKARSARSLPSMLRWIATGLLPYTHAGWAFAILAPVTAAGSTAPNAQIAPSAGRRH